MSKEDKAQLREKYERFKKLTPEKKKKIREAYKKWQSLDESKKDKIRSRFSKIKKMDPNVRRERMQKIRDRRENKRDRLRRR
jgi:hypothetical protein